LDAAPVADHRAAGSDATDPHARHRAVGVADADPGSDAVPRTQALGLLASAGGYTLAADGTVLDGAPGALWTFRITDRSGAAVHDYTLEHERQLHLVVVGRDLAAYHHLHPTLGTDGTWTVALPPLTPGAYRAFADFTVAGGPELTLGVDLFVPGGALYTPLPPPSGLVNVHGYDVSLTGAPAPGDGGEVALTIAGGGAPVTDLQPYLGALGHLVVIRTSDLAFVHAHPLDEPGEAADAAGAGTGAGTGAAGPTVRFHVAVDAPGDYRMFFEFAHVGVVHVAPFTVRVPPPPP